MSSLEQRVTPGTTVGVSNYSLEQMVRAGTALAHHDVSLASNQVEYSLLCRKPETSGLLDSCKRNNITMIAYSPLGMGLLTGKYSPGNLPAGTQRAKYTNEYLKSIQPLIEEMKGIGNRTGKTLSQIALNWVICKGAVPIPGVKNKAQAEEIIGATGWSLISQDVKALDDVSNLVT